MKTLATIVILFISKLCSGQNNTSYHTYKSFPELTIPKNVNCYSFPKSFTSAGSGSGWTLNIYSDNQNTFTFIEAVDCIESLELAKGSWTTKGSSFFLVAGDSKRTYDVVIFSNYTFLIERNEKQSFLKKFDSLRQKFGAEPEEVKYERIYLNLQDDFLNRRGMTDCR